MITGKFKPIPSTSGPQARPFEEHYIPEPNSGCFLWLGNTNKYGYGVICRQRKVYGAHRFAWAMTNGDPGQQLVLHRCDNPACVNPDHMFLGSPADNMQDMIAKGRSRHVKSAAKLTVEQVRAIRSDTRKKREIAAEYGIAQPTVSAIQHHRTWADV